MYNLLYLHKIIKIKLDTKIKPSQYKYKIVFKILFLYCISPQLLYNLSFEICDFP